MNKVAANVLVIDDDPDVLHTARVVLKPQFSSITVESNPEQINYLINHNQYDVILLDMNYTTGATSGKEGLFWLKNIITKNPMQQVIMMTAYGDIKLAVEAMKIGASDFVVKPWENEKLQATVYAAYNLSQSKKEVEELKNKNSNLKKLLGSTEETIIGHSASMKNIFSAVDKVASTDANVLILGDNGTGKEMIARSIHNRSNRSAKVFIKVDLGAISENLFESELFGHKKGAFTDAREERIGRFELADGGTLFLDEIGNLSLAMQAKLLTAIQHKEIVKVGNNVTTPVDCRIVAATNSNLLQMVAEGKFREDLLYRINTVEIHVPRLRDRTEDIPLLANHFLNIYAQKYRKPTLSINKKAMEYLCRHSWPGNIRELQHAIERAVIMADDNILRQENFLLSNKMTSADSGDSINMDKVEKSTIEKAIAKNKGNISKAAKELGLGRTTIYRKMDKYGIRY
ncbi:sigma-54-dependent Fis family transcriptional regulator [Fulvivirga sp. 29W222]|uniref:Sigma-54-dependent Fis family transcriptional regulator n=1 Tax=Fulvivirga marina TaxID=2494733 RepID=A0A937FXI6_9BACT|nr:sigma-54 dependent transcriptional regulator [Fulvivirga marina]MBL6446241.1 sigma-54-dependent Fis family transcriptional regulator [Fulvivirga marina]